MNNYLERRIDFKSQYISGKLIRNSVRCRNTVYKTPDDTKPKKLSHEKGRVLRGFYSYVFSVRVTALRDESTAHYRFAHLIAVQRDRKRMLSSFAMNISCIKQLAGKLE